MNLKHLVLLGAMVFVGLATLSSNAVAGDDEQSLAGTWSGLLILGATEKPIQIAFQKSEGRWTASIDFLASDKPVFNPVKNLKISLPEITFSIPSRNLDMLFVGSFEEGIIVGDITLSSVPNFSGVLELTEKIEE